MSLATAVALAFLAAVILRYNMGLSGSGVSGALVAAVLVFAAIACGAWLMRRK